MNILTFIDWSFPDDPKYNEISPDYILIPLTGSVKIYLPYMSEDMMDEFGGTYHIEWSGDIGSIHP